MRAFPEVARVPEVDEPERLEVRDLPRPEGRLLRRGEPEEELRARRDQLGSGHPRGDRHLAGQRRPAVERASGEAPPQARHAEEPARAQAVDRVVDVRHGRRDRTRIATSFASRTVSERVAREPACVEERRLLRAGVDRQVRPRGTRDEPIEVRDPPGDRDAEPRRSRLVVVVELRENVLERGLGVLQSGPVGREPRRHHLVVERRHEHLDVVLGHDLDALEQVLLGKLRRGRCRPRRRRGGELVDELVDPHRSERARGGARYDLAPGRAHVERDGAISTSESSSCLRYAMTFLKFSGGARCSESV